MPLMQPTPFLSFASSTPQANLAWRAAARSFASYALCFVAVAVLPIQKMNQPRGAPL